MMWSVASVEAQASGAVTAPADSARLTVTVRNEADGRVPNAEVIVVLQDREVRKRTDATGVVRFALVPDTLELLVRGIGYTEQTHALAIGSGESGATVKLQRQSTTLGAVHTVAERSMTAREMEIDNRIRSGIPTDHIRREYIDKVNPISLLQMIQRMRGVTIGTTVEGTRVPMTLRGDRPSLLTPRRPCFLRIMVDNILLPEKTDLDAIPPVDVYAVELFAPARIPREFAGTRNDLWCGLIAVWTRTQ
ncbi:MAG TPA: carboxypeptidase regulatory-like domain-containing protein [Gemmatimonas aurantiaca]|uniref:Carboxypeptidase regulatory-like domain-containing protein n=2 Tax=Gemmatimonas aurantiaca TaxID=173480 RepID=C1A836_GEMAT|nr:hypothetical protein GAU_1354 [Gemmatimonas aurantiaca T-27]HCT56273.1 carboxypeptidase regulatory-like domain-containing protein [Gemmatimonas aurantiaca]